MSPRPCSMLAIMGTILLAGCTACPRDNYCASAIEAPSANARPKAHAVTRAGPRIPRVANPESKPSAGQAAALLSPQNQAKFVELLAIEIVGRSRSYTGDQLDPNTCAEQCLSD